MLILDYGFPRLVAGSFSVLPDVAYADEAMTTENGRE
jgi:hypothetical protein